jgi:hypothetical protein
MHIIRTGCWHWLDNPTTYSEQALLLMLYGVCPVLCSVAALASLVPQSMNQERRS